MKPSQCLLIKPGEISIIKLENIQKRGSEIFKELVYQLLQTYLLTWTFGLDPSEYACGWKGTISANSPFLLQTLASFFMFSFEVPCLQGIAFKGECWATLGQRKHKNYWWSWVFIGVASSIYLPGKALSMSFREIENYIRCSQAYFWFWATSVIFLVWP